jgi:Ion channel
LEGRTGINRPAGGKVRSAVHRLVEPDHYIAVLALTILALLSFGFLGNGVLSNLFVTAIVGANLVYSSYTSRAPRPFVTLAALFVLISVVLTFTASVVERGPSGYVVRFILATALVTATPLIIARRLAKHPVVSVQTITGALCVYVLFGLFFASMYRLLSLFGLDPFFTQTAHPDAADYVYFSFVTLTTVGYGDLTTTHNLARMLAVTEALLGQFYLVTVIAVLVSRRVSGGTDND